MGKAIRVNWSDPPSVPPRRFRIKGIPRLFKYHGGVNSRLSLKWEKKRMAKEGYYFRVIDRGVGKRPRFATYRRKK